MNNKTTTIILVLIIIFYVGYSFYLAKKCDDLAKELTKCGMAGLEECAKNAELEQKLSETNT